MTDAFKMAKDVDFKIDDSTGSIADITAYVNNASISNAINILDITAYGETGPGVQGGFATVTVPINFFVNSTTEAIFGPLLNRTSTQKTVGFYNGIKWYTGEFLPSDVEFSGEPVGLQLGSCNLTIDGVVTRTSVAPA